MEDSKGIDAIYVTDYIIGRGLPIVGHAYLFVQDSNRVWYKTEYGGDSVETATIWVYTDNTTVEKMLKGKKY